MKNIKNLNESINNFEKILELNEKNIDPKILEQLQEIFCNIEFNFSNVEDELHTTREKLTETEEELNRKKEIIWNNKELRGEIIGSVIKTVKQMEGCKQ